MEFSPASQNGINPPNQLNTRLTPHILVSNTATSYWTQGITLKVINTAPYPKTVPVEIRSQFTPAGTNTTSTVTVGSGTFVGATATIFATNLGTGTNLLFAHWPGESRYQGFDVTMTNSLTILPGYPLNGLTLRAFTTTQYYGENTVISLSSNNNPTLNGTTATITITLQAGLTITTSSAVVTFSGNTANYISNIQSLGTVTYSAHWQGQVLSDGHYYISTNSNSITENLSKRTFTTPISLSVSPNPDYQGEIATFALLTTSTHNLTGTTATVFVTGGQSYPLTFVGNVASTTATFNSTGSFNVFAYWYGGKLEDNKYYNPVNISAVTETITWHTLSSSVTLTASKSTYSNKLPVSFTAHLNTTTSLSGNITFYDSTTVLGISTITNNTASLTLPAGTLSSSGHNISAHWNGELLVPYYFGKDSNTVNITVLQAQATTASIAVIPNNYSLYSSTATANTNLVTANITLSGANSGFAPSGIVTLSDQALGIISTATLTTINATSSTATISWRPGYDPVYFPQLIPGTRTLQVSYSGDDFNNSGTTTATLTILKSPAYVYLGTQGYINTGSLAGNYMGPVQVFAQFGNATQAPATVTFHANNGTSDVQTFTANVTNGIASIDTGSLDYYGLTWSVTYPTNAYFNGSNSVTMPSKVTPTITMLMDPVWGDGSPNQGNPETGTFAPFLTTGTSFLVGPGTNGSYFINYSPNIWGYGTLNYDSGPPDYIDPSCLNEWIFWSIDKIFDVPEQYKSIIDQTVTINYYQLNGSQTDMILINSFTKTMTLNGDIIGLPTKYVYDFGVKDVYGNEIYKTYPIYNRYYNAPGYNMTGDFGNSPNYLPSTSTNYISVPTPYNGQLLFSGKSPMTGSYVEIIYHANSIFNGAYFRSWGEMQGVFDFEINRAPPLGIKSPGSI